MIKSRFGPAAAVLIAVVAALMPGTEGAAQVAPSTVHPSTAITANGSWPVYHHDDGHTGYDAAAAPAISAKAGWTSALLDGSVYGEPLVYQGIVYVATLNNTVYALNQTDGTLVWSRHLRAPKTGGWQCGNVSPQGILGTPVIDPGTNRIYAASFGSDNVYRLEGLNVATGVEELNTVITTPAPSFDWTIQQERGALAVRNGYVYVPFGGRAGDCGAYHGWIFGVPTNGGAVPPPYVTPGQGAGFWNAGGVVVDDSTGKVFDTSGNGTASGCDTNVDGTPKYENDAVVRLSASLAHEDAFIPLDWQSSWCSNDQDLGSASMVLISPTLAFQAGKWGQGFLLNPQALGGMDGQLYPAKSPYTGVDVCYGNHGDASFGSYSYAAPYVYLECEGNGLVGLQVSPGTPSFSACDATCAAPTWTAGAGITFGPPIVAGGAVWAVDINGGGLYGFDASTGAQIYQSAGFGVNHFSTPSEAGGQIFVAADTTVRSFTMVPGCKSVTGSASPTSPQTAGTPVAVTGTAASCPDPSPLYEFWILNPGASTYQRVQSYSVSPTFNWATSGLVEGTYTFAVLARDAKSAGVFSNGTATWDADAFVQYTLTPVRCTSVSASASPPSPQPQGTPVAVAGNASGCPNALYQFWMLAPGSSTWQKVLPYSSSASFSWSTVGRPAGLYHFSIWARDSSSLGAAGDSLGTWDAYTTLQYTLQSTACTAVGGSSSPSRTASAGTPVTISGLATGCGSPRYQFWMLAPNSQSWQKVLAYSTSAGFSWSTAGLPPGAYTFSIWARDASSPGRAGNSLGTWDAYTTLTYQLTSTPCSSLTATSNPSGSATAGNPVSITGNAAGCPNPQYEFWVLTPGSQTWTPAKPYPSTATFNWTTTGKPAGVYHFSIWAKDASSYGKFGNSLGRWDAYIAITYTLT